MDTKVTDRGGRGPATAVRRALLGGTVLVGGFLALAAAAWACNGSVTPYLNDLVPSHGPAGAVVHVTGGNWSPASDVALHWVTLSGDDVFLFNQRPSTVGGAIDTQATIPATAEKGYTYQGYVQAVQGENKAVAAYRVESPTDSGPCRGGSCSQSPPRPNDTSSGSTTFSDTGGYSFEGYNGGSGGIPTIPAKVPDPVGGSETHSTTDSETHSTTDSGTHSTTDPETHSTTDPETHSTTGTDTNPTTGPGTHSSTGTDTNPTTAPGNQAATGSGGGTANGAGAGTPAANGAGISTPVAAGTAAGSPSIGTPTGSPAVVGDSRPVPGSDEGTQRSSVPAIATHVAPAPADAPRLTSGGTPASDPSADEQSSTVPAGARGGSRDPADTPSVVMAPAPPAPVAGPDITASVAAPSSTDEETSTEAALGVAGPSSLSAYADLWGGYAAGPSNLAVPSLADLPPASRMITPETAGAALLTLGLLALAMGFGVAEVRSRRRLALVAES